MYIALLVVSALLVLSLLYIFYSKITNKKYSEGYPVGTIKIDRRFRLTRIEWNVSIHDIPETKAVTFDIDYTDLSR